MVPYLTANQGADLNETAERFGVSTAELARDLNLLFVSGPRHYPDELMDITVEDNRIFIDNAERLSQPVRLGMDEACALIVGLETLAGLPGFRFHGTVGTTLAKLREAAGDAGSIGAAVATQIARNPIPQPSKCFSRPPDGHRVLLDYLVPHRDEITRRTVEPLRLFSVNDRWYLEAWCLRAEGIRNFRLDRMQAVMVTKEVSTPTEPRRRMNFRDACSRRGSRTPWSRSCSRTAPAGWPTTTTRSAPWKRTTDAWPPNCGWAAPPGPQASWPAWAATP